MLIAQFARRAGMSTDTVRYYVRLGLLRPDSSGNGGARPYQVFTAEHLLAARFIRTAQSLGMPLKEVSAISQERRSGGMSKDRSIQVLSAQLERLASKAAELAAMRAYLEAKIEWLAGGEKGPPPELSQPEA
jgi:MerR family copper efflux transcriptional regulator